MTRGLAVQPGAKTWAVAPSALKVGRAHFSLASPSKTIAVGESIPAGAMVDELVLGGGFDPAKKCFKECVAGKKVLVVGQPGAFTPC
jgi:hypothetical protein